MGVKNKFSSEYKTSFRSKYPCFTKLYEQNLGYRIQRRSTEHFHHVEPFLWDTDSSENDSDHNNCSELLRPSKSVSLPPHVYKHEKYNKAYRDQLEKLKKKFETNLKVTTPSNTVQDKGVMTSSRSLQQEEETVKNSQRSADVQESDEEGKHEKSHSGEDVQESTPPNQNRAADQDSRQSRRPRNPVQQKAGHKIRSRSAGRFIPKPRPFSPHLGRPLKNNKQDEEEDEDDKAPFLPYGYKYRSLNIGRKKTYNVRASADIYPSALLAQKRRKALISRQEELEKSAPHQERQKRALYDDFNERVRRETAQWETEYRRNFAAYNKEVYERSLSARPASHQHANDLLAATW